MNVPTPPASVPVVKTKEFKSDFNSTWIALVETLEELNFEIESADKDTGIVNTKELENSRRKLLQTAHFYGKSRYPISSRELVTVNAVVSPETEVTLELDIREYIAVYGQYQTARSRGLLEQEIFSRIDEKLAK